MRQIDGTEALQRVRRLRRDAPPAERILWRALRGRGLAGAKFRRQVWIGPYIADFLCMEARLIVELDGGQHARREAYDQARDAYLSNAGYGVLRIWNGDVEDNMEGTLLTIERAIATVVPSPSHRPADGGPLPLPAGEGF